MSIRKTSGRSAIALATLVGLASPALAQGRAPADPEMATLDDKALVQAIDKEIAAGDDRVLSDLETLLARVARRGTQGEARNVAGDSLVETQEEGASHPRYETLRASAQRLVRKLPRELKKKLAEGQVAALATERSRGAEGPHLPGSTAEEERLLDRYPLVPGASATAAGLAAQAFEESDELAATSLDRLAARLAALATGQAPAPPPAARVRRAVALLRLEDLEGATLELARAAKGLDPRADAALLGSIAAVRRRVNARAARRLAHEPHRPPAGFVPDLLASYRFTRKELQVASPLVAPSVAHVGRTVFASDGSRVLVVSADAAELEGRLPQEDDEVAPPGTQVAATIAADGNLVYAPLFFESFLLPARGAIDDRARAREGDPTVRGGFYSLFVFDALARRLVWWDGDAGREAGAQDETPRGRPAGTAELDELGWQRLAHAHVAGKPLVDGRRVYVSLLTSSSEPQVWVAAYERATGDDAPLALVPAWRTFLAASVASNGAGPPSLPAINPRLALDPDGRVIVQTDLGVVASLDARTGSIEWLVRLGDDEPGPRLPRRRGEDVGRSFLPANDPPVVVAGRGGRASVVVLASVEEHQFLGLSAEDGSVVWKESLDAAGLTSNGSEAVRVAALAPDVVALYGGSAIGVVDGLTGKSLLVTPAAFGQGEWPAGPIARGGTSTFVVPLTGCRGRTAQVVVRRGPPPDRAADARDEVPLEVAITLGETFVLNDADGALGLLCLDDRLIAVSGQSVNVYSWHKPD